jgi:NADH dehydrogenase/NADH:ubiquinone oxidoreductase subunit G
LTSDETSILDFGVISGQTAADAIITVDGLTLTRSSNQIDDAIPGVTLNLLATTDAAGKLGLARDVTQVKSNIAALVSASNDLMSIMKDASDPKSNVDLYGGTLVGDSIVSTIKSQVRSMFVEDSSSAAASGDITALWLVHTDPVRDQGDSAAWTKAMASAGLVVAHATSITPELAEHANVVFPAQAGAEREGTITHPDGRIQRLRQAISGPAAAKPAALVINAVAQAAGFDPQVPYGAAATAEVGRAVSFYELITTDELGGTGIRWQDREAAANLPEGEVPAEVAAPAPAASPNGSLLLGSYRSIWAAPEVEISPALKFLARSATVEISPADAARIGVAQGGRITVATSDTTVNGTATIRSDIPEGAVFVEDGITGGGARPADGQLVSVTGGGQSASAPEPTAEVTGEQ